MLKRFRDWLLATYNGIYVIVLKPYMPTRKTILLLIIGFFIGLLVAYVLSPTVFYDADPSSLHQSWQNEWVRLLADRYVRATTGGASTPELDSSIIALLRSVDNPVAIVDSLGDAPPGLRELALQAEPGKAAPQPSLVNSLIPFVVGPILIAVLTVVLVLVWGLLIYGNIVEPILKRLGIIKTQATDEATRKTMDALREAKEAEAKIREAAPVVSEFGPPIMRRMSIYIAGRGQYDDSFEIEDSNEMFLGECGATIAETIGSGDPEKVTAVEVWLFDKDDFVRTMTNVFVSEHAYNDPSIRSKLETKGELIPIRPGAVATLETNSLRLQARIVEATYGAGPLPPNSYFEKLSLEISAWQKAGGAPVMAAAAPVAMPMPAARPPVQPQTTYTPVMPQQAPYTPASAPQTLPSTPPVSMPPPPRRPPDDDPFGGTGDFTPIS